MFSAISDPILQVALWAGLIALALTAVMALAIVLLRLALLRDQQRWDRFVQTWRPLPASPVQTTLAAAGGVSIGLHCHGATAAHPRIAPARRAGVGCLYTLHAVIIPI